MLGLYASKGDRSATDALAKALTSDDRAVRRSVALALGRVGGSGAADSLASALSFDDGSDAYLSDGLARGLERLGRPGIDALLSLANSGVQKDSDRVLEVFLTFRTRPAFDALVRLLENPHLSFKQRADLVRSAGQYRLDPPASLDPLLAHVEGHDGAADLHGAMLHALAMPAAPLSTKGEAFAVATLSRKEAGDEPRRSAIRVLARTASGSRTAGRLWLDGRVPGEFRKDVVAALRKARRFGCRGGEAPGGGARPVGDRSDGNSRRITKSGALVGTSGSSLPHRPRCGPSDPPTRPAPSGPISRRG
ncbi:MAG: HEAT repeat domain-containing protein [Gemmataceae bacterium]